MVELSPRILNKCGIFEDYHKAELKNYKIIEDEDVQKRRDAFGIILDYAKHIENAAREGIGLFLYGSNGSGKTHLTVGVLKHAILKGYTGQLVSLSGAFTAHMDAVYGNMEAREWLNRRVKNIQFLVIDDALKETGKSENLPVFFDNLIRHRMRRSLPTIISTNGTIQDFELRYGKSLVSLLMGKSIPVKMIWTDYRREVMSGEVLNRLHGNK
jgi:DNA replication protein DnaC